MHAERSRQAQGSSSGVQRVQRNTIIDADRQSQNASKKNKTKPIGARKKQKPIGNIQNKKSTDGQTNQNKISCLNYQAYTDESTHTCGR